MEIPTHRQHHPMKCGDRAIDCLLDAEGGRVELLRRWTTPERLEATGRAALQTSVVRDLKTPRALTTSGSLFGCKQKAKLGLSHAPQAEHVTGTFPDSVELVAKQTINWRIIHREWPAEYHKQQR